MRRAPTATFGAVSYRRKPVTARFCSPVGPGEVLVQQPGVRDEVDRAEAHLGERAAHDDAVEDARVVVDDLVRLVGTARTPVSDGVLDRAVAFDEAFLHHHRRLRRRDVRAVGAVDVERRRHDAVAAAEHEVVGDSPGGVSLPVPAVDAATAERVDHPAVPALRPRGGAGLRFRERVVQHRHLVDTAVEGAGLHPDHVGHALALGGRGHGEIVRVFGDSRGPRGEGAARGAVEVVHPRLDRAVLVDRLTECAADDRQAESRGLAGERLLVGPGEDRPLGGVVGDGEFAARTPAPRHGDHDVVAALAQAAHPAGEGPAPRVRGEPVGDVDPVDVHGDGGQGQSPRDRGLKQRVARGDHVGATRQHPQRQLPGARGGALDRRQHDDQRGHQRHHRRRNGTPPRRTASHRTSPADSAAVL